MRLISLNEIEPNMVLGKSIYSFNNKLLLGAGFRLSSEFKTKLVERGYNHIYIMEEGTEDVIPEDIISDEVKYHAKSRISDEAEEVHSLLKIKDISHKKVYDLLRNGYLKNVNITYEMKKVVNEIFADITSMGVTTLNTALFKSKDSYQMDHALNTSVLSILIGKKYGFSKEELLSLGLGAFLHDFGKIVLEKIRSANPNSKTADELLNEHPTFGYLVVHNSKSASPIVSQIINQHHECQDGSGFPIGRKGENIPPTRSVQRKLKGGIFRLAEIVSVANAYDNLVMNPLTDKALSPSEAIKQLILNAGTMYNKHIVNTLTTIIPFYPVGTLVRIKNIADQSLIGYRGVVAKINKDMLNKPFVILIYNKSMKRIKPKLLDTAKLKNVDLELVL